MWYASDGAEMRGNLNMTREAQAQFERAHAVGCTKVAHDQLTDAACPEDLRGWGVSVSASSDVIIRDFVKPFLEAYGVDVFMAGHWHYCASAGLDPPTFGARPIHAALLACSPIGRLVLRRRVALASRGRRDGLGRRDQTKELCGPGNDGAHHHG